jgi:hypothetical protein
LISKKFEKEIVFESSVLAWIRIRNRIRIEQKCWIRIRKKSIWIHSPVKNMGKFLSSILDPDPSLDPVSTTLWIRIHNPALKMTLKNNLKAVYFKNTSHVPIRGFKPNA